MNDLDRVAVEEDRYLSAAHRVQTAISAMPDHLNQTPKHMRTGIDMSKSDMGGLATLLIAKGVFTKLEYANAMADAAEREADRYESELSDRFGATVRTV